jgi:hypothetical protein
MKSKGAWDKAYKLPGCSAADQAAWLAVECAVGVVSLPLHLAPVVGSVGYCAVNGALLAAQHHELYFDMRGVGRAQQRAEVMANLTDYAKFGLVAQVPPAPPSSRRPWSGSGARRIRLRFARA